jgi:hypothetical protein
VIQGNGLKKNAEVLPADNFKAKSGNKQTHTHWHHRRFSLHNQKAPTNGFLRQTLWNSEDFYKGNRKREIYTKLTATGRTSPRVPNAKTATRESRCCLPPLESMFENSSSSGTKVRDSSENFTS